MRSDSNQQPPEEPKGMKIVNPRGRVITADFFEKKLGKLVSTAMEASATMPVDEHKVRTPCHQDLRQYAAESVRKIGLDLNTKEGQAAAGASLLTESILAGIRQYEKKTGKAAPREVIAALEERIAQTFLASVDPSTPGEKKPSFASLTKPMQRGQVHRLRTGGSNTSSES